MGLQPRGYSLRFDHLAAVVRNTQQTVPLHNYGLGLSSVPVQASSRTLGGADVRSDVAHRDVGSRFGERLRGLRQERSLTQAQMAKKFGIDRSFISDVERGRKSISLGLLEVIAIGLKVSLSDLFRGI